MTSETSGILDGNALFADLPFAAERPEAPISEPPPATYRTHLRRDVSTARTERPVDPTRARLIAIITCGSVALAASLGACFLYAMG